MAVYVLIHDDGWTKESTWVRGVFANESAARLQAETGYFDKYGDTDGEHFDTYSHNVFCCGVKEFQVVE
jgi:hypothetical protein